MSWPQLLPEVAILALGTLLLSFMVSRWHYFGMLCVWPVTSILQSLVWWRGGRRGSLIDDLLLPFLDFWNFWDAEPALWPPTSMVLTIATGGAVFLYGWRGINYLAPGHLPGVWVPAAAWFVAAFVYIDSDWPPFSAAGEIKSLWRLWRAPRGGAGAR